LQTGLARLRACLPVELAKGTVGIFVAPHHAAAAVSRAVLMELRRARLRQRDGQVIARALLSRRINLSEI